MEKMLLLVLLFVWGASGTIWHITSTLAPWNNAAAYDTIQIEAEGLTSPSNTSLTCKAGQLIRSLPGYQYNVFDDSTQAGHYKNMINGADSCTFQNVDFWFTKNTVGSGGSTKWIYSASNKKRNLFTNVGFHRNGAAANACFGPILSRTNASTDATGNTFINCRLDGLMFNDNSLNATTFASKILLVSCYTTGPINLPDSSSIINCKINDTSITGSSSYIRPSGGHHVIAHNFINGNGGQNEEISWRYTGGGDMDSIYSNVFLDCAHASIEPAGSTNMYIGNNIVTWTPGKTLPAYAVYPRSDVAANSNITIVHNTFKPASCFWQGTTYATTHMIFHGNVFFNMAFAQGNTSLDTVDSCIATNVPTITGTGTFFKDTLNSRGLSPLLFTDTTMFMYLKSNVSNVFVWPNGTYAGQKKYLQNKRSPASSAAASYSQSDSISSDFQWWNSWQIGSDTLAALLYDSPDKTTWTKRDSQVTYGTQIINNATFGGSVVTLTRTGATGGTKYYTKLVAIGLGEASGLRDTSAIDSVTTQAGGASYDTIFTKAANGSISPTFRGDSSNNSNHKMVFINTPSAGYAFKNWTDKASSLTFYSGSNASAICTVSTTGNDTLIAADTLIPGPVVYCVTTITAGTGGTITTPGSGKDSSVCGSTVSMAATASAGYRFVSWSASSGVTVASTSSASTTFSHTDSAAGSVTASFSRVTYAATCAYVRGFGTPSFTADSGTVYQLRADSSFTWDSSAAVIGSATGGAHLSSASIKNPTCWWSAAGTATFTFYLRPPLPFLLTKPLQGDTLRNYTFQYTLPDNDSLGIITVYSDSGITTVLLDTVRYNTGGSTVSLYPLTHYWYSAKGFNGSIWSARSAIVGFWTGSASSGGKSKNGWGFSWGFGNWWNRSFR